MHHLCYPFGGVEALMGVIGIGADHLEQGCPIQRLVEVVGAEEHRQLLDLAVVAIGGHGDLGHLLLRREHVCIRLLSSFGGLVSIGLGLLQLDRCLVVGLRRH